MNYIPALNNQGHTKLLQTLWLHANAVIMYIVIVTKLFLVT